MCGDMKHNSIDRTKAHKHKPVITGYEKTTGTISRRNNTASYPLTPKNPKLVQYSDLTLRYEALAYTSPVTHQHSSVLISTHQAVGLMVSCKEQKNVLIRSMKKKHIFKTYMVPQESSDAL